MDRRLLDAIMGLKGVKRMGWVESGVKEPETVADHTCAVALIVLFKALKERGLDLEKALTMALVHDLAETVVGDITPADRVPPDEKKALEREAFDGLLEGLDPDTRSDVLEVWDELEEGESPEARLVLDADVFDRLVQARIYKDRGEDVERFFRSKMSLKGSLLEKALEDYLR